MALLTDLPTSMCLRFLLVESSRSEYTSLHLAREAARHQTGIVVMATPISAHAAVCSDVAGFVHAAKVLLVAALAFPADAPRLADRTAHETSSYLCSNSRERRADLPDWWEFPEQCQPGHPWGPGRVIA